MATIKVISKVGDTNHLKYGRLVRGKEYDIDEADFGDEIFEKIESVFARSKEAKQSKKEVATPARNGKKAKEE